MLRFLTSGESHGSALIGILDGFPSGLALDVHLIDDALKHRQMGYGRGARQKLESDSVEIIGGVRHGVTSGAPISFAIRNKDWENWQHVMSALSVDLSAPGVVKQLKNKAIKRFRPGHADLAGTLKYRQKDIRDVLERASARETAARVAVGAICQQLLGELGVTLASHVVQVGSVKAPNVCPETNLKDLEQRVLLSEVFCADEGASQDMKALIKSAWQQGDSLGGVVEVLADGLPVGLGTYTQWDSRLDGQIAQALMSVQAMKAVEIGDGVEAAALLGSLVHDAVYPVSGKVKSGGLPFTRKTNHAGGIEGGMTNGERLRVKAYMKPLPTLRKGLPSVSFPEFTADIAHYERSDVSAIAAASVVCKAMLAFVLAKAFIDKFGGDTIVDIKLALTGYVEYCNRLGSLPASTHIGPGYSCKDSFLEGDSCQQ
ncbi:MAG: chorismate synthase [Candidatus Melainabacteria bacterium]|nr:chorismate synthase [Candidatus Melainabacteria bacterium]